MLTVFLGGTGFSGGSQPRRTYTVEAAVVEGDTVPLIRLRPIVVFNKPFLKNKRARRQYDRLVRAFKLVYPIALAAKHKMYAMEDSLLALPTRKQQKAYIKGIEKELKKEYTPVLKRMSLYQGRVLLKLIDRETGNTSYELVKEFRGGFSAFFWQGVARIFGANLKTEYHAEGEDQVLEQLVYLYEEGLL